MSTVIVGASAAGLSTAACLEAEGVPFTLLEASGSVGTAWRNHYERLHLHTEKALSALPFLPFPREAPRYPSRAQVVEYLERYAARLKTKPTLGARVTAVKSENGKRIVEAGQKYEARSVVIATGYTRVPQRPSWPGSFAGRVLHSSEYKSGRAFAGQRVLVVGIGNSGGEIALDLCEQGARASIAVRSAVNAVPRDFLGLSILAWGILLAKLPLPLADAIARTVSRISFGRLDALGLRTLPYGPMRQIREHGRIPLIDVGTLARVRKREIEVLPDVASLSERAVRFADGSERDFDAIVLATGYRPALADFVSAPEALDESGCPRALEPLPGLFFCGFRVSPRGMLREIASEARSIARRIANRP